jgi:hypothetical protein
MRKGKSTKRQASHDDVIAHKKEEDDDEEVKFKNLFFRMKIMKKEDEEV